MSTSTIETVSISKLAMVSVAMLCVSNYQRVSVEEATECATTSKLVDHAGTIPLLPTVPPAVTDDICRMGGIAAIGGTPPPAHACKAYVTPTKRAFTNKVEQLRDLYAVSDIHVDEFSRYLKDLLADWKPVLEEHAVTTSNFFKKLGLKAWTWTKSTLFPAALTAAQVAMKQAVCFYEYTKTEEFREMMEEGLRVAHGCWNLSCKIIEKLAKHAIDNVGPMLLEAYTEHAKRVPAMP
ncbi:hypothetical protein P154DRAFT_597538 [Amniculicola lignicola CBS 123094]|uniref:Uncharacterized protein n=1 Tax=Amniculicola lignicola CBS 123094 TaxID=1392246 RepID=A0A6A5WZ92_9PLEO|nr:hypothetical protein P154DRAFT_597538 [Amniculicola lignicola CBS 123094]